MYLAHFVPGLFLKYGYPPWGCSIATPQCKWLKYSVSGHQKLWFSEQSWKLDNSTKQYKCKTEGVFNCTGVGLVPTACFLFPPSDFPWKSWFLRFFDWRPPSFRIPPTPYLWKTSILERLLPGVFFSMVTPHEHPPASPCSQNDAKIHLQKWKRDIQRRPWPYGHCHAYASANVLKSSTLPLKLPFGEVRWSTRVPFSQKKVCRSISPKASLYFGKI